jgi:hypothetical protein
MRAVYTLLTIGDGLVAQIPSLLLSTAAAIMVTRMSRDARTWANRSAGRCSTPRALLAVAAVSDGRDGPGARHAAPRVRRPRGGLPVPRRGWIATVSASVCTQEQGACAST